MRTPILSAHARAASRSTSGLALGVVLGLAACAAPPVADDVYARRASWAGPGDAHPEDGPAAAGDPALAGPLPADLDALLERALRDDPGIRERFAAWREALAATRIAGAWPDAQLRFGHFLEPVETRTGPQRNRLGVSQPLPWPDELDARQDAAARAAEAAWWAVEERRHDVVAGVSEAYWDLVFLGQQVRLAEQSLHLLESLEPVVQSRLAAGGAQADLIQLQVEIAVQSDLLAQLREGREARAARLDPFLGEGFGAVFPMPQPDLEDLLQALAGAGEAPDFVALREQLVADNPELRAWAERVAAQRARGRAAERAGRPDLAVGVDWIDTGSARTAGVPGSGDDPLALTLQMSLPFDRGRYAAEIAAADGGRRAALRGLDRRRRELLVTLRDAIYGRDDAVRRVVLHRDSLLPSAQQALALTESGYRGGRLALSDFVERVRAVLAFEEGLWRALLDHERARVRIDQLTAGGPRAPEETTR